MILIIVQPYNNQIRIPVFYVTTLSLCNYDTVYTIGQSQTQLTNLTSIVSDCLTTEHILQRDLVVFYEVDDTLLSRGNGRQ